MEEPPRIRNSTSLPGELLVDVTLTPGILPFNPSPIVVTGTFCSTSPPTFEIEEVNTLRDSVP